MSRSLSLELNTAQPRTFLLQQIAACRGEYFDNRYKRMMAPILNACSNKEDDLCGKIWLSPERGRAIHRNEASASAFSLPFYVCFFFCKIFSRFAVNTFCLFANVTARGVDSLNNRLSLDDFLLWIVLSLADA